MEEEEERERETEEKSRSHGSLREFREYRKIYATLREQSLSSYLIFYATFLSDKLR